MKVEFPTIEEGSRLILHVTNGANNLDMDAVLVRHIKDYIALIKIENIDGHVLKFDNVVIHMIYANEEGLPYIWLNCNIAYYQGQYLLQVPSDGGRRHNRRSSFRVGVSKSARMRIASHGEVDVLVRDISLSGFSITDRRKELNLSKGTSALLRFEDMGQQIEIEGNVVRIEEDEGYVIYGFAITKSCRDLSTYVTIKQRKHRT